MFYKSLCILNREFDVLWLRTSLKQDEIQQNYEKPFYVKSKITKINCKVGHHIGS